MMKIFPILQIILLAFFVNAGKDSSDHPDPDLNQPTIEEKAKGKDSPDYLDLNQPTVDEEAKGKDSPDHPDLNQTTAKAKRQRISLQDTEVPIPSAVKGNVAGSKGKAKATATGSDREDSGVSGIGKRNRVGVLLRDAMKATQVKGKAPAHGKKTIKTDMTNKTPTERDDAGQSKFTSLKNWLSSNLDSIKKIKKENVVNSKNLDTLLTIGDIGGNLLTGQIRNALFGAVGAVKGHVENKEREKERVELINQMVEMNEEFKEYYESLNGAIYRMVSSNSNQGNNSGYFQDVVLPFEMMKTFFEALVSSNKKQEKQTDKKFKQKREMAQNAYARKCKKNPALKALLAIKSYVNDSLWPENYSVNFLDHRNKKKELVRFIGKIIFQTQYLQLYATTCVDIDDKNEIEFDIISQTYSEIKILLNKWLNQALDLAWPRLFTEKVIPDAVNSIIMKLENNEITAKTLNLIAQKIVEESLQYGRKCFKYQAIVVKKDDCTVKDYKCPWIDLPKYSKLDPDNSMDQASIRRSKIKIEKEASSSKDNDANEEGSKNMQNVPICVLLEYSGLQIWLARMFIVDYDESVPTHSTVKYTEKVEELVKKENNDKLMESIQSGLPQKITGRLWITSTNFKTDKCSIGIASELISGAVDYGLEKYEISNQGGKKHFFFFNPKGNEKIITHAKLFAHSNSFTINFLNKDGIVLHHFHDLDDMNHRMRIGQFVHVQNRWEKTNSQDYNYFNVNETFNLELEFDIGPNKIITYLNSVKVYEFKRDLLARIERLVIAGNMQLQNLIQENDNGKHELYKHKDSSSVDMGPLLALTMGPSINEK